MILPQANLKASQLDKSLVPHKEIVKAYEDVGQVYDRSVHDRVYEWFYTQVNGNDKTKNQLIEQKINGVYRIKDSNGEWLVYGVGLFGRNWKGNRVDFFHMEGKIEGMPVFHNEVDPQTDQIVPGTTQVEELRTVYTIPFTKQKVDEISEYFTDSVGFCIQGKGTASRTYSCSSLEEFRDMEWDKLIKAKTEYLHSDYYRNKQLVQAAQGGVR